ncbi:MAG: discoidin domain-containing protein [Blastocatellia bacterium]
MKLAKATSTLMSIIYCLAIAAVGCLTAAAQNVPEPPSQIYDRLGSYHWNVDYTGIAGYDGTTASIPSAYPNVNNLIASLKTRTVRFAISPNRWKGTASQSSTDWGGVASKAIDGISDGHFSTPGSVTHTNFNTNSTNPWWETDLGSSKPISMIRIWNRTDCCSERLQNFYVFVSDQPIPSDLMTAKNSSIWRYFNSGVAGEKKTVTVDPLTNGSPRTGRYVRIWLEGTNAVLSLAEVEIYDSLKIVADSDSQPFKALLNDNRFDTYVITAFDPQNNEWGRWRQQDSDCVPDCNPLHLPPPDYNDAYQQIRDLAEYVTGFSGGGYRFPRKTFIISNWEADSELSYYTESLAIIPSYGPNSSFLPPGDSRYDPYWAQSLSYFQTRASAIANAKAVQPGSQSDPARPKLFSGFEFNRVNSLDGKTGAVRGRCGSNNDPARRCTLDMIAQNLTVDYYLYSAYDILNGEANRIDTVTNQLANYDGHLVHAFKKDLKELVL